MLVEAHKKAAAVAATSAQAGPAGGSPSGRQGPTCPPLPPQSQQPATAAAVAAVVAPSQPPKRLIIGLREMLPAVRMLSGGSSSTSAVVATVRTGWVEGRVRLKLSRRRNSAQARGRA